jgi:hypothetical protein
VNTAKSTIEEPDEAYTHDEDIEQDEEELCRILQEKIESLGKLNTSLECPARDYFDERRANAGVVMQAISSRSHSSRIKTRSEAMRNKRGTSAS